MLQVEIKKDNGIPIYLQMEEQIRLLIHQGKLKSGDSLPTVRSLSIALEINANTVSRVYRDLQNQGVLKLRRGIGTFVNETPETTPVKKEEMRKLEEYVDRVIELGQQLGLESVEISQLIETRWEKRDKLIGDFNK